VTITCGGVMRGNVLGMRRNPVIKPVIDDIGDYAYQNTPQHAYCNIRKPMDSKVKTSVSIDNCP